MKHISASNGRILIDGSVASEARLLVEHGSILSIDARSTGSSPTPDEAIDLRGGWLLPGFVDVQVNGAAGILFNTDMSVGGLRIIAETHLRHGTTSFLPTLISDTPDAIASALSAVDTAIDAGVPGIVGVHIEGPFINLARKGIHHPDLIRRLDGGLVELLCAPRRGKVMLTLAPEEVAIEDIALLRAAGVILSAGHTDATYRQAMEGFAAGVTGVTHLYNAMSPLHHREPGMVGAALYNDEVWCGIIADGVHTSAIALEIALRVKGAERVMLVTDAMPSLGMENGSFELNGRTIRVEDGICLGECGTLAGSSLDMATALRNMVEWTSADVAAASLMASTSPAAYLGMSTTIGALRVGARADFVVLDADLRLNSTWTGGIRVA